MEIDSQSLTTCDVAQDGGTIRLGFIDSSGNPASIRLSLNDVGALAMTLPELLSKALRTRYGEQNLRYTYPLSSWTVERSSDPATAMVTLNTTDGFSVCFSMPSALQHEFGEALLTPHSTKTAMLVN